jgi:hypothetical protein
MRFVAHLAHHAIAGGRPQDGPAEGGLSPLSPGLKRQIRDQCPELHLDLDRCRYRSRPSSFPEALADIEVFDAEMRPVIIGRTFPHLAAFWLPDQPRAAPSWYTAPNVYQPPAHHGL